MGLGVEVSDVVVQGQADVVVFAQDGVICLAVAPQLVGLAGVQVAAAPVTIVQRGNVVGAAVAVHAQDGGVYRELVPADQQLAEIRVVHVVRHEAAHVRRPPGYARKAHVEPALQLVPKGLKGAGYVARPNHVAVLLAAGPAAAEQVHHVAAVLHGVVEDAAVQLGIQVGAGQRRADGVAVVIEVVNAVVRLGVVQPEGVDSEIEIVLFANLPDVFPGLGVEHVDLHAVALIVVGLRRAAFGADQQSALHHLPEVFAPAVHAGPDGDDHPYPHGVQLLHHGPWVRPVGRVEFPVALHRPVEEVDHDHVDLDALLPVAPGHGEHLRLGAVPELALPQAHQILREHPRAAGDGGVVFQKLLRRVRDGDPVIHLAGRPGGPLGQVPAEGDPAHGGIVPQQAVAEAGDREGHADLAVALGELEGAALQVQVGLLVLAHAVEPFAVVGIEAHGQSVFAAADVALPFPVHHLQAAAAPGQRALVGAVVLAQDQPVVPVDGDDPGEVHHGPYASVGDGSDGAGVHGAVPDPMGFLPDLDLRFDGPDRLGQRPVHTFDGGLHGGAEAQGILPPGLDAQRFAHAPGDQRAAFVRE